MRRWWKLRRKVVAFRVEPVLLDECLMVVGTDPWLLSTRAFGQLVTPVDILALR
jgi:hypothetical protein